MKTAMELYTQFCDAEVNDTQSYQLLDVSEITQERTELKEEIDDLNNNIARAAADEENVDSLREERNGLIETLEKMDNVLAVIPDRQDRGYIVTKRPTRDAAWSQTEPVVYVLDDFEAEQAAAFFNAHDIITNQPKESA